MKNRARDPNILSDAHTILAEVRRTIAQSIEAQRARHKAYLDSTLERRDSLNKGDRLWNYGMPCTVHNQGKGQKKGVITLERYDGHTFTVPAVNVRRPNDADPEESPEWIRITEAWALVGDRMRNWFKDDATKMAMLCELKSSSAAFSAKIEAKQKDLLMHFTPPVPDPESMLLLTVAELMRGDSLRKKIHYKIPVSQDIKTELAEYLQLALQNTAVECCMELMNEAYNLVAYRE